MAEADFIRDRIHNFELEAPENLQWQTPHVRNNQALPLYVGWTETLGIRADGVMVRWSTEDEWPGCRESSPWLKQLHCYPDLQGLHPKRPSDAMTCDTCHGTGRLDLPPELSNVRCKCAGLGSIPL